jgi:hypothetical protein
MDNEYVVPLNYHFDIEQIKNELEQIIPTYKDIKQINLKCHNSLETEPFQTRYTAFGGSIKLRKNKIQDVLEKDFTLCSEFQNTYIEKIINQISALSNELYGREIGRVRVASLFPKDVYSYHFDEDPFRFHIPIQTNKNAMFLINDLVRRMPEVGMLYKLKTDELHSALNLDFDKSRTHILFSTVPNDDDIIKFAQNNAQSQ